MVAKNNPQNIKVAHFSHAGGKDCEGAVESAIHLLAKQVFFKTKQIHLPNFHHDYNNKNESSFFREGQLIEFDSVATEVKLFCGDDYIIADAIGYKNGKQMIVEFANTHFVDFEKMAKIKNGNLPCVEIDLKSQSLDITTISNFLISDSDEKYWIHNPRLENEYKIQVKINDRELAKKLERKKQNELSRLSKERDIFWKYKKSNSFSVLKVVRNEVKKCGLRVTKLKDLKQLIKPYPHPIVEEIINGEYWNGKFYGNYGIGKYIYYKNKQVMLFPPGELIGALEDKVEKDGRWLYAGLKEIQDYSQPKTTHDCSRCNFFEIGIQFESYQFIVCKFGK